MGACYDLRNENKNNAAFRWYLLVLVHDVVNAYESLIYIYYEFSVLGLSDVLLRDQFSLPVLDCPHLRT